jgi:nucleoside-diphosphate-sugar epimerase
MKILITGGNGFIARNIKNKFNFAQTICLNRKDLDLTNQDNTDIFFKNNFFDVVIHTATVGGSRLESDDKNWVYANLLMYQNINKNQKSFSKLINLTSGAELDRRYNINGESVFDRYPIDPYGLSKNLISRAGFFNDKFFNLRIYNVFNHDELPSRMISNSILNNLKHKDIIIHQDKYMDFFHINDLIHVLKFYCQTNDLPKNLDCSYDKMKKLSDISNIINKIGDFKSKIIIEQSNLANSYCGDPRILSKLNLNLMGIEMSIKETYINLKSLIV